MVFPNEHQKARRLIQLELDGLLGEGETAWLVAHIETCSGCQSYAAQLHQLDQAIRLDSAAQRTANAAAALPRPTHTPAYHQPGFTHQPLPNRKKARMNFLPLKSFANTLVSLALLAALASGLSWILSIQAPMATRQAGIAPTSSASPAAVSTHAPIPTPRSLLLPEVNDPAQIIAVLAGLAEKDAAAYRQGSFWAYQATQDLNESGSDYPTGPIYEQWVHFEAGKCLEMLATSRNEPKSTRLNTLQVGLPDGTFGELVALRQGLSKGLKTLRTDWKCAVLAGDTDAGMLAARLKPGEAQPGVKDSGNLKQVRAWYENQPAAPLLVVEAVFTGTSSGFRLQRETRRFNMSSGRMLQADIATEWADGRPSAAFAQSKSSQFLPKLPESVLRLFEQSADELLFYRDQPLATATPVTIFK